MLDERGSAELKVKALEETYNVAYRHYDDLIWRVPVWATGLLTATMVGLNSATQETLARTTGVAAPYVPIVYLFLMFTVMLTFSFVLHRFRVHQRRARIGERRKTPIWKSASTLFSFLVCLEAFFLLGLALLMIGMPVSCSVILVTVLALGLATLYETKLRSS